MYFIDDIEVGMMRDYLMIIDRQLHQDFIKLSGDDSPIHTDVAFCKRTKFKNPIGHAFLLTALLSNIYGKKFPGGTELCLRQTSNFKAPFYIGDKLTFSLEVVQKNVALKIITIRTSVANQNGLVVFEGDGVLSLELDPTL